MLETRVVQIGGIPVRYAVDGEGDPLVLIHGLAGSWRWWRRNVPAFRERRTVYLVDLPGFGGMRRYRRLFSLRKAPEWVLSLFDALQIRRAAVIGHSMGGAISLAFAARWPDRVERLVLAAPAVNLPHKSVLANVGPLLAAAGHMQPRFYPTLVWDGIRAGLPMLVRTTRQLIAMDIASATQEVRSPTLLIWGSDDDLVPVKGAEVLRSAIHNSRLLVIEHAGHILMFDRPADFNTAVLKFLSGETVGE